MMVTHENDKGYTEVPAELSRAAYKYAKARMRKRVRTGEDVQRFRGYAVEYLRGRLASPTLSDQQLAEAVSASRLLREDSEEDVGDDPDHGF